jgi:hypothetical protein
MRNIQTLLSAAATCICLVASGSVFATTKAEYDAAKDRAKAEYKVADDKCSSLAGNAKDVCKAQAKADRKKAEAAAEADYKNTPKARRDAAIAAADADYDVAKQKCDAMKGNDKDVCVKEAKAAQTKATADAKASEKSISARKDANEDKRDADYKVAIEKCDGLSGDAKDACKKDAKAKFGK